MLDLKEVLDKNGKRIALKTSLEGFELLNAPKLNKSCAFNADERSLFKLTGKLPAHIESIEEQAERIYNQYLDQDTNLQKNVFLNNLHDRNEVLFYKILMSHLTEMLPIVYTPTVGDAVENFSLEFRNPRGLHIAYEQQDIIEETLKNRINKEIDLILVTDGEGVLGIGDQGIGGMDIAIGKLMVYTACGNINPNRVLPIQLDVGTNNEKLLKDPCYLGWRHKRIEGNDYYNFIDKFVSAVIKALPGVFLHWEDFGVTNAHKNLMNYRKKLASFNDDIQGTGATTLACLLAGLKSINQKLEDQRIVMLGAGTAGIGVADQLRRALIQSGLTSEQALAKFWLVDREGLLLKNADGLLDFQKPFARNADDVADWAVDDAQHIMLQDVVTHVKPTILIGCSTAHGAFTEDIVKEMAKNCPQPIILPLSNPTSKCEATPEDLFKWTEGKALIGSGSPFNPVAFEGETYIIAQCNNAYMFPGIGLGTIASRATQVTDGMIKAACETLAAHSPAIKDIRKSLLPKLTDVLPISKEVALAVAEKAREEGVAGVDSDVDLADAVKRCCWTPEYLPLEKD